MKKLILLILICIYANLAEAQRTQFRWEQIVPFSAQVETEPDSTFKLLVETTDTTKKYITMSALDKRYAEKDSTALKALADSMANISGDGAITNVACPSTTMYFTGKNGAFSGNVDLYYLYNYIKKVELSGTSLVFSGVGDRAFNESVDLSSISGGGTVTSVGLEAPNGMEATNSPITSAGTLGLGWKTGYRAFTDDLADMIDLNYHNSIDDASVSNGVLTLTQVDGDKITATLSNVATQTAVSGTIINGGTGYITLSDIVPDNSHPITTMEITVALWDGLVDCVGVSKIIAVFAYAGGSATASYTEISEAINGVTYSAVLQSSKPTLKISNSTGAYFHAGLTYTISYPYGS